MASRTSPTDQRRSPLLDLSNAMVGLHREHFGRGPAAAKSVIADDLAICVLTDIFTPVERRLVEAGRGEHVQLTRMLHHGSCEEEFRQAAAAALGRPIVAVTGTVHIEPDMAIEVFVLDRKVASPEPGDELGDAT